MTAMKPVLFPEATMDAVATRPVRDMDSAARTFVEGVFGNALPDDAVVTFAVGVGSRTARTPTETDRTAATARVRTLFAKWDGLPQADDNEVNAAIDEAVAAVRAAKRR